MAGVKKALSCMPEGSEDLMAILLNILFFIHFWSTDLNIDIVILYCIIFTGISDSVTLKAMVN